MICGEAAGSTIWVNNSRLLAPMLRADQINSFSTPWMAMTVAAITGKMASTTMMVILDVSYTPSHRITTGRKAIFGIGKPTETIGSKNQLAMTLRDIAMPMSTPPTAQMQNAVSAR